jgi:hypothetical protein
MTSQQVLKRYPPYRVDLKVDANGWRAVYWTAGTPDRLRYKAERVVRRLLERGLKSPALITVEVSDGPMQLAWDRTNGGFWTVYLV